LNYPERNKTNISGRERRDIQRNSENPPKKVLNIPPLEPFHEYQA